MDDFWLPYRNTLKQDMFDYMMPLTVQHIQSRSKVVATGKDDELGDHRKGESGVSSAPVCLCHAQQSSMEDKGKYEGVMCVSRVI